MAIRKIVRKTKTVWEVSYRDASRKKRYISCPSKAAAELIQLQKLRHRGSNPHVTVGELASRFLEIRATRASVSTIERYECICRVHILPDFGATKAWRLVPSDVELWLARKRTGGLKPATVSALRQVLYGILAVGVRDGNITHNVVASAHPWPSKGDDAEREAQAFTREELDRFLASASKRYPHIAPMFLTMARTGLRVGEALALKWSDVDLGKSIITVSRSMSASGRIGPTKTRRARTVDVSAELGAVLEAERKRWLEDVLRAGRLLEPVGEWCFRRPEGGHLRPSSIARQVKRVLKDAGLPGHFHSHCLRHTFASTHLQMGTPIVYVKEQLGHASINMTVDIYGSWLSKSNPDLANRLDGTSR